MSSNRYKVTENLLIIQGFEMFFMIPATFFLHFSMIPTTFFLHFSMIPQRLGGLIAEINNCSQIAKCRLSVLKKWAKHPLLEIFISKLYALFVG